MGSKTTKMGVFLPSQRGSKTPKRGYSTPLEGGLAGVWPGQRPSKNRKMTVLRVGQSAGPRVPVHVLAEGAVHRARVPYPCLRNAIDNAPGGPYMGMCQVLYGPILGFLAKLAGFLTFLAKLAGFLTFLAKLAGFMAILAGFMAISGQNGHFWYKKGDPL